METIKSAQRVCEIFEFFNEVQRPLMLKEIVSRFGYPASSCSVLLKSLVQLGFLEYDALHRTYLPTMRMSSLVEWVEKSRFGNGSVLSAMRRLHELTQETVSLGAQSDLHAYPGNGDYPSIMCSHFPLPCSSNFVQTLAADR